jgi:hypothetical protein
MPEGLASWESCLSLGRFLYSTVLLIGCPLSVWFLCELCT